MGNLALETLEDRSVMRDITGRAAAGKRIGPDPPDGTAARDTSAATAEPPPEVSVSEAASILECDPNTVRKMIRHGMLRVRNRSGPWSSRPRFAIELRSVMDLRCSHRTYGAHADRSPKRASRRSVRPFGKDEYIRLD